MEEEKKSRKKRKISIITVFLWLFLIVTMSVITIGSIRKQNAIENSIDKVTIKLDMSQIDDEVLEAFSSINFIEDENVLEDGGESKIELIGVENKIYTYELEEIPTEDFMLYFSIFDYYENGELLESKIIGDNNNGRSAVYYKEVKVEELKSEYVFEARGEKLEVSVLGSPIIMALANEEFEEVSSVEEVENGAIVSPLVKVKEDFNIGTKWIGVRTSKTKSILMVNYDTLYEKDKELRYFEGVYIKDLTDSNNYHFSELREATVVNIKVEGLPNEILESLEEELTSEDVGIYFMDDWLEDIDIGKSYLVNKDLVENQTIKIISSTYLPQDTRFMDYYFEGANDYTEFRYLEKNGELIAYRMSLDLNGIVKGDQYNEFNITAKFILDDKIYELDHNTYAKEQIKWIDKDIGKAEIILSNTSSYVPEISFEIGEEAIYVQTLDKQFVLSSEYENNEKWKIVEHISDEIYDLGVATEILKLFKENINLKYIYVKDSNTIYWKYNILDFAYQGEPIYVYFKDYETVNQQKEILSSHQSSSIITNDLPIDLGYDQKLSHAEIKSPNLGFEHLEERNVVINKMGTDGIYHIGLFEDDTLTKIEKLEVVNSSGSVQISLEDYDANKNYTIYEVDENGNKLSNISYPVDFANSYDIRNAQIISDKTIVSSVRSGILNKNDYSPIEESTGTGESDYVDNMLSVKDIYQAKVTIKEENIHRVNYEAEEGGKIEGETEEYVKDGETPQKVPNLVPEEGYEFDKWVVVENGEEVEVNPSEYVVTKDVTFIAKFKKVDKVIDIDTSDIQVWVYVVVAIVAVVGIVVVIFIVRKNKVNSKDKK